MAGDDDSEALLQIASEAPDVAAEHAKESVRAALFGEAPARVRIGRFTILGRIGEGGMGVVFEASDPELDRKVAIKLIRSDASSDSMVRVRLLREAKALARLSDPHVVQVYEVGEHDQQVYIAMEFVEGLTLADWMRREPTRNWRDSVRMFREVGRGLAAAHAAGVVHRDFKPANVLLGNDGRPRVVDFGLALFEGARLDETGNDVGPRADPTAVDDRVTASHAIAGTPAYMAPEQFEHRSTDARTDQFAFCIAVWEAVYQVPPFDRRSFEVLATQVTQGRVQVRTDGPSLPVWLRRALRRGLDVDPKERWPSMDALLEALDRGLDRRRRLRRGAMAVGVLAVGGIAGAVGLRSEKPCAAAVHRLLGVWDAPTRVGVERAVRDTGVSYATQTWTRIEEGLTAYTEGWIAMHAGACEAARRGEQSASMLDRRMACLERRWVQFEADIRALESIDARGMLGAVSMIAALPELSACADVERLMARDGLQPPGELAATVHEMEGRIAEIQAMDGLGKVRPALEDASALRADAEAAGFGPIIARARLTEGLLLESTGDYKGARAAFEQTRLEAVEAGDDEIVFRALDRLVFNVGLIEGDADAALPLAELAHATLRRTGAAGSPDEAFLHDHVGAVLRAKGDYEGALARHRKALALLRSQLPDDNRHIAVVHVNLGVVLFDLGQNEKAIEHYEAGLDVLERGLGAAHPDAGLTHLNIALAMMTMGGHEEALPHLRTALEVMRAAVGEDHPDTALIRSKLGRTLSELGKPEEGLVEATEALDVWKRALGPDHLDTGNGHDAVGAVLRRLGRLDEARAHFERHLELRVEHEGPDHPNTGIAQAHLAALLLAQEDYDDAVTHYKEAIRVTEATRSENKQAIADQLSGLGQALVGQGEAAEATMTLERALTLTTIPSHREELEELLRSM